MASTEPIDGRCGAVVKPKPEQGREGGYCEKWPLEGQQRCGTHGARAPQAIAAAGRRVAEAEVERHLATLGAEVETTAEEALNRQLRITAGHCAWLLAQVQQLEPEALVWSRTTEHTIEASQFPGVDTTREAAPHALLATYERHLKLHLGVVDMALKHNLGERQVRLAEQQGQVVAAVIRSVLRDLGHDLTDPAVLRVVSTQLRALGAEPAA